MNNYRSARSFIIYSFEVHPARKMNDLYNPSDVCGRSLEDLFSEFCAHKTGGVISVGTSGRYVKLSSAGTVSGGLLVKVFSGLGGEERDVYDAISAQPRGHLETTDVPMVETRVFLYCRYGEKTSYLAVEHANGGAGFSVLPRLFGQYLSQSKLDAVLKYEALQCPEAIRNFLSVENIEIRTYLPKGKVFHLPGMANTSYISSCFTHKRGRPFPVDIFNMFLDGRLRAAELIGVASEVSDNHQIRIKMKDKTGGMRTYIVGEDVGVQLKEELSPAGCDPLCDEAFVARCKARIDEGAWLAHG